MAGLDTPDICETPESLNGTQKGLSELKFQIQKDISEETLHTLKEIFPNEPIECLTSEDYVIKLLDDMSTQLKKGGDGILTEEQERIIREMALKTRE